MMDRESLGRSFGAGPEVPAAAVCESHPVILPVRRRAPGRAETPLSVAR